MRKLTVVIAAVMCLTMSFAVDVSQEIADRILNPSVKLVVMDEYGSKRAIGSAVVFVHDGTCYALTAGHCVRGLRHEREVVRGGQKHIVVEWSDAQIAQDVVMVVEGTTRKVGELLLDAKVIAYSPPEEEDLAVLKIYKRNLLQVGARFLKPEHKPYISQDIYHVGALYGELGHSLSKGIIAAMGRVIRDKVYHQCSSTAAPGSSGGGVWAFFDDEAYYIGMLTMGIQGSNTINFFIPASRIRGWLTEQKLGFILHAR